MSLRLLWASGYGVEGARPRLRVFLGSLSPLLLLRAHGLEEVFRELTGEVLIPLVVLTSRVPS